MVQLAISCERISWMQLGKSETEAAFFVESVVGVCEKSTG